MNRENYVYQASTDGPHSSHGKLHASISNQICPKDKIIFFQIPISSFPPGFFILKMLPQQGRNPEVSSDSFSVLILTS